MLFPLLVFMVIDYGRGDDPRLLGRYTGFLASCFPMGILLGTFFWGWLSDRVGRKPVLLFGLVSSAVLNVCFGLTRSYEAAVCIRILTGVTNFVVGSLRSMVAELTDDSNQAQAMSIYSMSWIVGSLLGPVFAGLLARPCVRFECAPGALFMRFPFLLPFLAISALNVLSFVCILLFVPETLAPEKRRSLASVVRRLARRGARARQRGASRLKGVYVELPVSDGEGDDGGGEGVDGVELLAVGGRASGGEKGSADNGGGGGGGGGDEGGGSPAGVGGGAGGDESGLEGDAWEDEREAARLPQVPVYRDRKVVVGIGTYALCAFMFILLDELFPLYASYAPELGGLGFDTKKIGYALTIGAVCTIPWLLFGYKPLIQKYGSVGSCAIGSAAFVFVATLTPLMSVFRATPGLLWSYIALNGALRGVTASTIFSCTAVIVNNSAPPGKLGFVNSLAQFSASLLRTVGPSLGGLLWSIAVTLKDVRGHQTLPFLALGVFCVLQLMVTRACPKSLNKSRRS